MPKTNRVTIVRIATAGTSLDLLLKDQIKMLSQDYKVYIVSNDFQLLEKVSKRENAIPYHIDFSRQINLVRDLICLFQLIYFFLRTKPALVHSITPKAGLLSMLASSICKVPHRFHTFTGLIFPSRKGVVRFILSTMDRITCRAATKVFAEGQGVWSDLIKNKITTQSKVSIIANGSVNGVDTNFFQYRNLDPKKIKLIKEDLKLNRSYTFIFIGRVHKEKGIFELLEAFVHLNIDATYLLIIGDCELSEKEEKSFKNIIRNRRNIIWLGFISDTRYYLASADCLVLPSYREGFPNVLLEAGSMDLPCIATNINGSNEIILENITGNIVEPRNPRQLEVAMMQYYLSKAKPKKFSGQNRINIVSKYDRKIIHKEISKLYYNTLNH